MFPIACCPGSYDPITRGHIASIEDAAACFAEVVVAVGDNPSKNYLFNIEERLHLARAALAHLPTVRVVAYQGMLVEFMAAQSITVAVRGLRNDDDLHDAMRQDDIGRTQPDASSLQAVYLPARPEHRLTSSSAAKVIIKNQGDASSMLTPAVLHATRARLLGQYLYGITGQSGSGKGYIAQKFASLAAARGLPCLHINLDALAHEILGPSPLPRHVAVREEIISHFGPKLRNPDGSINRKALGQAVFANPAARQTFNMLIRAPLRAALRQQLIEARGIVLVDGAILAENDASHLVNHHVLLLDADFDTRLSRLKTRDNLNTAALQQRDASQLDTAGKAAALTSTIAAAGYGALHQLQAPATLTEAALQQAFETMLATIDIWGDLRRKNAGLPS